MSTFRLLPRDQFREGVFARDKHRCVLCGDPGQDAHHILERRLFTAPGEAGGYFLENGVTVCGPCHLRCESTEVSVEAVREAAKILKPLLQEHLYEDQIYTKWGDIVMPNGTRLRGDLFFDDSVQKIIAPFLHLYTHYVKFPRTWHLPWSPGMHSDDRMLPSLAAFQGRRVIATKKMDGENTSCYHDYYTHARSVENEYHESRTWVKNWWAYRAGDLPENWRVVVENLYAEHSIRYDDLESLALGFHVWDDRNVCQSWDDTLEYFALLNIPNVEVLFDGLFDEKAIRKVEDRLRWDRDEGYVLRVADAFPYSDYRRCVGKFVRKGHVQTTKHHWKSQTVVKNGVRTA